MHIVLQPAATMFREVWQQQAINSISSSSHAYLDVSLQVQEAMLTGESVPISKNLIAVDAKAGLGDRKCMAFSATTVSAGQGLGVVVATGAFLDLPAIYGGIVTGTKQLALMPA